MSQYTIARNVGDLIAALAKLDPTMTVISHEPPWTGVKVVPQENGKVYIASLWNTDEGRAERAARKATKVAA